MSSLALSFNDVKFNPVSYGNNQIWLSSSELANALGYKCADSVSRIFDRHADEFTQGMTLTVNLTVINKNNELQDVKTRIFSLRGCHLLAIFARTAIAKEFRKWVLDILDREVLNQQLNNRQAISPEQQALLHEIVSRRSNGERKIYAEMWSRHNRHFNIPRYSELLAIHFAESVHYLECMELKAKVEKQQLTALPYPHEVIQIAHQINHEYNSGQYQSWFVHVRDDGQLSANPLPKGYYPINLAEFTKRFDGLLDFVYGNELLTTGRFLAKEL